ncbi:MAG TPA: hypothetical protein VGO69_00530 [Pyrinomonadaceae bacterium]|nr:hypothetical protein [Pyrinomonadaceae bacterium]
MMIEDFGAQVASVWEGMRSTTRSLIVSALQQPAATTPARGTVRYDARADWELSRLLSVLDERAADAGASMNTDQASGLQRMAEATASVLESQTQSAEVFTQLVVRAYKQRDFKRIDALADALSTRFAPSEVCELARSGHPVVRALAQEALAQSPTTTLLQLLSDPIDAEIARDALERQATEYDSELARQVVNALNQADENEEDEI